MSKEVDKRYRLNHSEKCKAKDAKRYLENRESELARNSSYYKRNREVQRVKHRNNRHKISQEWFDNKLKEQDGQCCICREIFIQTPHIDHDHRCCPKLKSCDKCRRGLLCKDCNLGLGRFKDNQVSLLNAVDYLQKYKRTNE